jgi:23S rRNA (cytidine1920-2'-O)/16S rRNA (cytidine1409-2'-O)-methyltransferase
MPSRFRRLSSRLRAVRSAVGRHGAARLDQWLVAEGHAATRNEAQAAIMAGLVSIDGQRADKPGRRVTPGMLVRTHRTETPFASRAGGKLAHALAVFGIDVRGKVAVDLGASTGGFTDCLLRAGASRVYAVDVGHGLLAWRLRTDPRVVCLEGVNARFLTRGQIGGCDLVTADLAFISLRLVWHAVAELLSEGGVVVALVKPQFEAGRRQVGRGGVVRDPAVHREVLEAVLRAARLAGFAPLGVTPSPLRGPAGNIEYLAHLARGVEADLDPNALSAAVAAAHEIVAAGRRPP